MPGTATDKHTFKEERMAHPHGKNDNIHSTVLQAATAPLASVTIQTREPMSRSTANHRDQFINSTELIGPNKQGGARPLKALVRHTQFQGRLHPAPLRGSSQGALDPPSTEKGQTAAACASSDGRGGTTPEGSDSEAATSDPQSHHPIPTPHTTLPTSWVMRMPPALE